MNYEHLKGLIHELIAHLELLLRDLHNIGFIDFNDDLISDGQICLYQVVNLIDELRRQHNNR
jgi:hypothetical protein